MGHWFYQSANTTVALKVIVAITEYFVHFINLHLLFVELNYLFAVASSYIVFQFFHQKINCLINSFPSYPLGSWNWELVKSPNGHCLCLFTIKMLVCNMALKWILPIRCYPNIWVRFYDPKKCCLTEAGCT